MMIAMFWVDVKAFSSPFSQKKYSYYSVMASRPSTPTQTTTTTANLNQLHIPSYSCNQFRSTRCMIRLAASASNIEPGIGEAGCKLPSPSGVNTLDDTTQQVIFGSILVALGICTALFSTILSSLTLQYEWFQGFRYSWPITLGLVFCLAGITHFTVVEEYKNIYPYKGAWGGLWQLPGSSEFHVKWTGVAELVGGIGLLAGGLIDWLAPAYVSSPNIITPAGLESDCAAALFLLTWSVTPSNIFMYTHGARLPMEQPAVPISFHVVRFLLQVVLLEFLFQMGQGTYDALLQLS
jgi:uncharacterized membrane protein